MKPEKFSNIYLYDLKEDYVTHVHTMSSKPDSEF